MNGWGYVPLLYSDRIGGGDGIGNREAFAETFFRDCGGSGIGGDKGWHLISSIPIWYS